MKNMSLYPLHTQYNSITGPAQFRDLEVGALRLPCSFLQPGEWGAAMKKRLVDQRHIFDILG